VEQNISEKKRRGKEEKREGKRRREEEKRRKRLKHRSNYFSLTLSKNIRDFAGRAKIANISEY
jgi:hypothetical protein